MKSSITINILEDKYKIHLYYHITTFFSHGNFFQGEKCTRLNQYSSHYKLIKLHHRLPSPSLPANTPSTSLPCLLKLSPTFLSCCPPVYLADTLSTPDFTSTKHTASSTLSLSFLSSSALTLLSNIIATLTS